MLRNVKDLRGYAIRTTDGVLGTVDDFYFDDRDWGIRYLVVDTGRWLSGRKVLISVSAIGSLGQDDAGAVGIAHENAGERQSRHRHQKAGVPVARNRVLRILRVSVVPGWRGPVGHGSVSGQPHDRGQNRRGIKGQPNSRCATSDDRHLRSSNAVTGYRVEATDGGIGHVEDLRVDDYTWAIRYLLVKTSNWWGGRHVLVAPEWIKSVSWSEATVSVSLTRQASKRRDRLTRRHSQPRRGRRA